MKRKLLTINGVNLMLERRRYGTRTFTWLMFYGGENLRWCGYGDPWPSVRIPKAQLQMAVEDIKQRLAGA